MISEALQSTLAKVCQVPLGLNLRKGSSDVAVTPPTRASQQHRLKPTPTGCQTRSAGSISTRGVTAVKQSPPDPHRWPRSPWENNEPAQETRFLNLMGCGPHDQKSGF
jgi:hypothetical protein